MSKDSRPVVLVVDDKKNMLSLVSKILQSEARVLTSDNGEQAINILKTEPVEVVLSDLRMPNVDGLSLLRATKQIRPQAEFILMTAYASVSTAVEAMRLGAYDYLEKPFEPDAARAIVRRALGRTGTSKGSSYNPEHAEVLPGIIAKSEKMRQLANMIERIAKSEANALLLGETGTGKELVARALHRLSERASGRFVAVNCSAIPAELLESELFGYARGSFTGAERDKPGLFEEANEGTLFLDEIGEMRLSLQAKLTRALEERAIRRIGESFERQVDVRLIAATHRDLETMVASESFRQDLWYRLNVAPIQLPPLRERREDVPLLAVHFLKEYGASSQGRKIHAFTPEAIAAMEAYDWPGNVRQVRSAIERACIIATGEHIDTNSLPPEIFGSRGPVAKGPDLTSMTWSEASERGRADAARKYLQDVLILHHCDITRAAKHASVERESFYRLIRKYGVDVDELRMTDDAGNQ